jgi:hypothetical protein
VALLLAAASPAIDLRGVITVAGNGRLEHVTWSRLFTRSGIFGVSLGISSARRGGRSLGLGTLRACYHPDATKDRGRFRGGIDDFIAWLGETLELFEHTWPADST